MFTFWTTPSPAAVIQALRLHVPIVCTTEFPLLAGRLPALPLWTKLLQAAGLRQRRDGQP